jgi:hypothetical protein
MSRSHRAEAGPYARTDRLAISNRGHLLGAELFIARRVTDLALSLDVQGRELFAVK